MCFTSTRGLATGATKNTETEKACVVAWEPVLNRREIVNILVYDFAQSVMLRQAGVADNREDALDVRVEQTLAQDALPDHARR
jgi:hypothetical protein